MKTPSTYARVEGVVVSAMPSYPGYSTRTIVTACDVPPVESEQM